VVEAQGCGVPVIAYGEGGARETVNGPDSEAPSGLYFHTLEPEALASTILEFERQSFDPEDCRAKARSFSPERFDEGLMHSVLSLMADTQTTAYAPDPSASG
jgi:glycosyltransferase involved in cell wall biosynthesis